MSCFFLQAKEPTISRLMTKKNRNFQMEGVATVGSCPIGIDPLLCHCGEGKHRFYHRPRFHTLITCSFSYCPNKILYRGQKSFVNYNYTSYRVPAFRATNTNASLLQTFQSMDVLLKDTFPLNRIEKLKGMISVRLAQVKDQNQLELTIGCNLDGKWILQWEVSSIDDSGSEWDQPPEEITPPGSIPIKDYAIETPLKKSSSSSSGDCVHEVKIHHVLDKTIATIYFVLKDEETGVLYQHKGRDFKVPLLEYHGEDENIVGTKKDLDLWPGALVQLYNLLVKAESNSKDQGSNGESGDTKESKKDLEGFYEELPIVKEVAVDNLVCVSVRKCPETTKYLLYLETDLPGDVTVHWRACRDETRKWKIPAAPHPPETTVFKNKALRTLLQPKEGGKGSCGTFTIEEDFGGFHFVLKQNENSLLNYKGDDFYVPFSSSGNLPDHPRRSESEDAGVSRKPGEESEGVSVTDISSQKTQKKKTKEAQESILQEIEKLSAEAYDLFRSSSSTEEIIETPKPVEPPVRTSSGTGTGFEILCQGFNWESHKSGRWYMILEEKAAELSSLGFTMLWLPPPTESVSPEGYMPKDLYNLNSRYGNIDELKDAVKTFHDVGIKVLGDVVLNHRCAHFRNQNGSWNIFGGRLNWDERAVVSDDPHFQGRGNKSSGDNFHAAPNIDHSQDFVRNDIKEWLCWLRKEIGYDGWRLDFVRGFWGGYVKDYLDASEPYFAVGEYWDSLSYTYGVMDYNQDAHRQRIIDWINATNGTAAAFDVTTKGILHSAVDRCEYWRLSDQKRKPPGVVGWWPSRAVTFIENHDTGSTQGHWRFPSGKEMQGYAYILTHPGTPSLFFDHIFSHYKSEIATLISLRKRQKLHCRSVVKIEKAERDVYAATMDEKVGVKIGPGYFEPPRGSSGWSLVMEGKDYKVWEVSN